MPCPDMSGRLLQTDDMQALQGVVTTGIYCCKGCPATPLRRNTLPFGNAAQAEAAGFRPCLRCRPDRLPDLGWIAAPELVCRAMHSIADGALDDATEDDLAEHLGVSARHLRRLFAEHIGATPSEVARSRRAHFARRLLDDTDLSMTQIAAAAGFNTVRQMNRVMQDIFRFTPSELRAKRRQADRLVVDGGLELRVPYRPPLAWHELLTFLAPRAIPGVEAVDHTGVYRRVSDIEGAPGVIEVWDVPREQALRLRVHLPAIDDLVHLVAGVRRLFDLDADPKVIDRHLARDDLLRPLVRARKGLRVPGALDPFELGVRAILGQQVSVGRATALSGVLVEQVGKPVPRHRTAGSHARIPVSGGRGPRRPLDPRAHNRAGAGAPGIRGRDRGRRRGTRPRDRPRRDGSCAVRAARDRSVDRQLHRHARVRRTRRVSGVGSRAPQGVRAGSRAEIATVATLARVRGDAPVGRARSLRRPTEVTGPSKDHVRH